MRLHGQFAVPYLVFRVSVLFQIVEELVGSSQPDLYLTIGLACVIVKPIRRVLSLLVGIVLQTAAAVAARSHISELSGNAVIGIVLLYLLQQIRIRGQVLVEVLVRVVGPRLIYSVYLTAIHSLPYAEGRKRVICCRAPP